MNQLRLLFLCLLSSSLLFGQGIFEPPPVKPTNPGWAYETFSFVDFGTGEEHSYFSIVYKLNPNLHFELQGFYDSYRATDSTDFSVRTKWYPTKRIFLFSGLGARIERSKIGDSTPQMSYRTLNGLGYEADENLSMEAVHDLNFGGAGLNAAPSLLTLKGKYRF